MFNTVEGRLILTAQNDTTRAIKEASKDIEGLKKSAKGAGVESDASGKSMEMMGMRAARGAALVGLAAVALAEIARALPQLTVEYQKHQALINLTSNTIKNMGGNASVSLKQMQQNADAIEKTWGLPADSVLQAEKALLRLGKMAPQQFRAMTELAANMAADMDTTIPEAANKLVQAIHSGTGAVDLMTEAGIKLNSGEKATLALWAQFGLYGRVQAFMMERLSKAYDGAAEASNKNSAGWNHMVNAWKHLQEEVGAGLNPSVQASLENAAIGVDGITQVLKDLREEGFEETMKKIFSPEAVQAVKDYDKEIDKLASDIVDFGNFVAESVTTVPWEMATAAVNAYANAVQGSIDIVQKSLGLDPSSKHDDMIRSREGRTDSEMNVLRWEKENDKLRETLQNLIPLITSESDQHLGSQDYRKPKEPSLADRRQKDEMTRSREGRTDSEMKLQRWEKQNDQLRKDLQEILPVFPLTAPGVDQHTGSQDYRKPKEPSPIDSRQKDDMIRSREGRIDSEMNILGWEKENDKLRETLQNLLPLITSESDRHTGSQDYRKPKEPLPINRHQKDELRNLFQNQNLPSSGQGSDELPGSRGKDTLENRRELIELRRRTEDASGQLSIFSKHLTEINLLLKTQTPVPEGAGEGGGGGGGGGTDSSWGGLPGAASSYGGTAGVASSFGGGDSTPPADRGSRDNGTRQGVAVPGGDPALQSPTGPELPRGAPGKYRPQYKLQPGDLSDRVIRTIVGEAKGQRNQDAVINTMVNRLGTKWYHSQTKTLEQVALAGKGTRGVQYQGMASRVSKAESDRVKSRVQAIVGGEVPDITGGAQEFRGSYYKGPWARKNFRRGVNIGGNIYAKTADTVPGPYEPYATPRDTPAQVVAGSPSPVQVAADSQMQQEKAQEKAIRLGRGSVDVNVKLAQGLQASGKPQISHAENFDVGLGVDKTGRYFARPGDPTYAGGGPR